MTVDKKPVLDIYSKNIIVLTPTFSNGAICPSCLHLSSVYKSLDKDAQEKLKIKFFELDEKETSVIVQKNKELRGLGKKPFLLFPYIVEVSSETYAVFKRSDYMELSNLCLAVLDSSSLIDCLMGLDLSTYN